MRNFYLYILIFLGLVLFLPDIKSQDDTLYLEGRIDWLPEVRAITGEYLLNFQNAVNHDDLGMLPVLQISLPFETGFEYDKAVITDEKTETIAINEPGIYPDLDRIIEDYILILQNNYVNKRRLQLLLIMPLKRTGDEMTLERLVSFRVALTKSAVLESPERSSGNTYADHSVLSAGDWYKLSVTRNGIHKITFNDLEAMGIDPGQTDPRKLRIFGNGSGMLEESVALPRTDDLKENTIYVHGEEDGKFDAEDYILFYGESPVLLKYNPFYQKFEHELNFYTDETFYFLTIGPVNGKRISQAEKIDEDPTHTVSSFQDLVYHEKEELNLIKSGQIWYGEVFNTQLEYRFDFDLEHLDTSQPLYLKASLAGRSTKNTEFTLTANEQVLAVVDVPSVVLGSSIYARALTSNYEEFYSPGNEVSIGVTFDKPGTTDIGWLNFIELNFIRKLIFNGGQMNFRDIRAVGPGNIVQFEIQSGLSFLEIWDVSENSEITSLPVEKGQGNYIFKTRLESPREYIAFDRSSFFTPVFVNKVANQDLHSLQPADFVIITYPDFISQATRLADFHRQQDGMSVIIVTPEQIYNEFSSGAQDVSAIRDFMKMLYDRALEGARPGYLLLFGDASFDFKGILPEDNNLVPAYQSRESLKMAASFVTDDYFGCLDEDEGGNGSGTVDIGIGRFPVHTLEQAEQAVDKVLRYASLARENFGPWRNEICFIGDDEDNNIHLNQAEGLTEIADSLGAAFNVSKVYLDAYAQLQTPSGTRYPDVNLAIDKSVNSGSLLVNYTGHGGEIGWASERVLDIPAIQAYKNIFNMPAFVTATCEFSRYDDPGLISAGELVFMNPEGAGIGLFTTTRLAYSQSNYTLNKRFYYEAFRIDSLTGEYPRMGDLIRVSKTPSNQNIKNFVLLGDPALMLAYPKMKVITTEIINENQGRPADTIFALSKVTVKGQIQSPDGNLLSDFNGIVIPSVFDKPVIYRTRGNDPTSKVTDFLVQDKILYKGEVSVIDGEFVFTFIVPKDISYQFGKGKISYYAVDTNTFIDAAGFQGIWVGGSDPLGNTDEDGPDIHLYLNHYEFQSGDITTPSPMLIAQLYDESGINTVGNGIGHDIVAVIDGNYMESIILNDHFSPETDSYQGGEIIYPIGPFENGIHTLTLKAWDVFNNSSEATIEFEINTGKELVISGLQAQPNPLVHQTDFVFRHNKPGVELDVRITIHSLMGQPVHQIEYTSNTETLESVPYSWDGRNSGGNELPSGLYVYVVRVSSDDGFVKELSQKLMICR